MNDTITVRGYVATDVRSTTADSGLAIAGFRMCTTERRYDRDTGSWADGQTNWFSVSLFRQLATNAAFSVHKGDRVIVTGRLKVRQWASDDGRSGTSVDIDAESVGHDLMWGTANYRRNVQERSGGASGGEGNEGTTGEDSGSDDLPADLDLETGELAGTGTGGPSAAGAEDKLQDPFTLSDSALLKDASAKDAISKEAASSKDAASEEPVPKDAVSKDAVLEGAASAGAGRGRGRMGG